MPATQYFILTLLVLAICVAVNRARSYRLRSAHVPPGPPLAGWLSGHSSMLPLKKPWEVYTQWANQYGSVMHFRAYNQRMVVISSMEDCIEIFEKRSSIYSDRPSYAMANLLAWDFNAAMMSYGVRWRKQRRLFQQMFRKVASMVYRPEQTRKVNDMLYGLLTSPEDFRNHIQTVSAAIVMSTTYGYDIEPKQDHFVDIAEESMLHISQALVPGARLVNDLPILRYLPPWFPGAGFHQFAAKGKEVTTEMIEKPFKWTQDQMKKGAAPDCIVNAKLLSCQTEEDVKTLQDFAATVYVAGADTTTAALKTFFYAMAAASPAAQEKAQQEIDRVVGRDRLPTYDDWESLPYTEAIVREVLRWRPVLPLGVPHRTIDDDVYKGYLIPKGSIIIANIWALAHNPSIYTDPATFNPDRFFDKDGTLNDDDSDYTFGFGRRQCPGRHMARATVWLAIATTLWAFHVRKAKDMSGKEIPISGEYSNRMVSHLQPHACSITPRFSQAERIIKEAAAQTQERMPC